MKKALLLLLLASVFIWSCDKELSEEEIKKEMLTKKIQDIIPQQYQDTLKKYGLVINEGIKPPNVEGVYSAKPLLLEKSNRPGDAPGMSFLAAKVQFSEQNNDDFSIKLEGRNFLNTIDKSIKTAVSGDGSLFTVYGTVKSESGSNHAIFAILMSGEMDGSNIKNLKYGLINVDNSNGGAVFIKEGEARIIYDSDKVSEQISSLDRVKTTPEESVYPVSAGSQ
ncbi:MAG: hypothetical protein KF845_12755 [Cyclobacteriaceae bacterium]|nr:hypothetical protein [Cyclobacteriaceae bacterium]